RYVCSIQQQTEQKQRTVEVNYAGGVIKLTRGDQCILMHILLLLY
ncbi:hypothetical protein L195_g064311, partial [Trifolium pratense]